MPTNENLALDIHEQIRRKLYKIPGYEWEFDQPYRMLTDEQQRVFGLIAEVVEDRNEAFKEGVREKLREMADEI